MKQALAAMAIISCFTAFPAPSKADPGQYQNYNKVFTRGSLNVNMCTSKGKNCHTQPVQNKLQPMPKPIMHTNTGNTAPVILGAPNNTPAILSASKGFLGLF